MDPQRFDTLVKTLSRNAARRGMVLSLLGGALSPLLASLQTAARRHTGRRTHRDDELSAEKRGKKKKCKQCGPCRSCKKGKCKPKPNGTLCSGGSCQGGACQLGDEAPPCTEDSCPLPPECSQQAFDACSNALNTDLQDDAEVCRAACEGEDEVACQACLEPILANRLPDIEACAAASCSSSARAAVARDWWVRQCDRPCCFRELQACREDLAETYALCLFGAVATCFSPAAPVCASAIAACFAMSMYSIAKCNARFGCPAYDACKVDNSCCPQGQTACGAECCDLSRDTCCGDGCCNEPDAICCRSTGENPFYYCCPSNRTCCSTGGNQCCLS